MHASSHGDKKIHQVHLAEKWEFLILCESADITALAAQSDPHAAHAHRKHDLVSDNALCMCTSVIKGTRPRSGQSLQAEIRDFRHLGWAMGVPSVHTALVSRHIPQMRFPPFILTSVDMSQTWLWFRDAYLGRRVVKGHFLLSKKGRWHVVLRISSRNMAVMNGDNDWAPVIN